MSEKKSSKKYSSLQFEKKSVWEKTTKNYHKKIFDFNEGYKQFLSFAKTERLTVDYVVFELKKNNFVKFTNQKTKSGDKLFIVYKEKVVLAWVVGKNKEHMALIGSHTDSPRLDLKPLPLVEESSLAVFKTHYYGGIKKYHWVNTPLSLHGVVYTKSGKKIFLSIGEKDDEPVFVIPDLLPHLAREQYDKKVSQFIAGEQLMALVGSIPVKDDNLKEKLKVSVLQKLNKEYGFVEEDFVSAELSFVPQSQPRDVGFDKSLLAAYGHDDGVCVYTSLQALLHTKNPSSTAVALFIDKEETGSAGDTGAQSYILRQFAQRYLASVGSSLSVDLFLGQASSLSADVTSGLNPNYKDAQDATNVSRLGYGVSLEKYGGGGGKYSTNDASAEYMHTIRQLLNDNNVYWQTGENGRIDLGGGGTIAQYFSRYGMSCVDVGPCMLGMHSPYEIVSKADVYEAYLCYKAFFSKK
ncbi:MAG: aminopeptidase [Candidatus Nanoarchaeia archaeon]